MKLSKELEEFFASSEPLTDEEYQSLIDASAELSKDPQYIAEVATAIEQHRILAIVEEMAAIAKSELDGVEISEFTALGALAWTKCLDELATCIRKDKS